MSAGKSLEWPGQSIKRSNSTVVFIEQNQRSTIQNSTSKSG